VILSQLLAQLPNEVPADADECRAALSAARGCVESLQQLLEAAALSLADALLDRYTVPLPGNNELAMSINTQSTNATRNSTQAIHAAAWFELLLTPAAHCRTAYYQRQTGVMSSQPSAADSGHVTVMQVLLPFKQMSRAAFRSCSTGT
jgi:hypothetical protein